MTQPRAETNYAAYRFTVEIGSITTAMFDECRGLDTEVEVLEIAEGGRNDYIHMLPGRVKKPMARLVLKRGLGSADLWDWYSNVVQGTVTRQNISIILYGFKDMKNIRWNITDALPVKWSGPSLNAGSNEVAFETIEFIHRGFKRVEQ